MSLNALSTAELLPGVEAESDVSLIGKNTCSCMRAGVIRGAALSVNGFISEYKREFSLPEDTCAVVTGAQAKIVLKYLLPCVRSVSYTHLDVYKRQFQWKKRPQIVLYQLKLFLRVRFQ